MKVEMKSMLGSSWDFSGGDRTDSVEPEAYKKRFHGYLFKKTLWNCMILYLFHLIFKILFFFQVLYIWTLKIIIDMHSLWPVLLSSCTAAACTVLPSGSSDLMCPLVFLCRLSHDVFFFFCLYNSVFLSLLVRIQVHCDESNFAQWRSGSWVSIQIVEMQTQESHAINNEIMALGNIFTRLNFMWASCLQTAEFQEVKLVPRMDLTQSLAFLLCF